MEHEHRFWNMGTGFYCACGESKADDRTPAQREAAMNAATLRARIRIHEANIAHGLNVELATARLEMDRGR